MVVWSCDAQADRPVEHAQNKHSDVMPAVALTERVTRLLSGIMHQKGTAVMSAFVRFRPIIICTRVLEGIMMK